MLRTNLKRHFGYGFWFPWKLQDGTFSSCLRECPIFELIKIGPFLHGMHPTVLNYRGIYAFSLKSAIYVRNKEKSAKFSVFKSILDINWVITEYLLTTAQK